MRRPFCSVVLVSELAIVVPAASAQADSDANTRQVLAGVQKAILQLPEYGVFDSLSFAMIEDGSVVLRGQAVNTALRASAGSAVEKVEGVTAVVNEIEVMPSSASDSDLRNRLYLNLYRHPRLSSHTPYQSPRGPHPIHIIVRDGKVVLTGIVPTVEDKFLAEAQANSTPGAFPVVNNLMVRSEMKRKS